MSRWISITSEVEAILDKDCPKDEEGKREETYSQSILKLAKNKEMMK